MKEPQLLITSIKMGVNELQIIQKNKKQNISRTTVTTIPVKENF
jgi:hypothetical protein